MERTSVVRDLWRTYRGLAGWLQAVIAVLAALVVVSPFRGDGDRQTVVATAPATTTTPAPGTTVPAGVPPHGDDTTVVPASTATPSR